MAELQSAERLAAAADGATVFQAAQGEGRNGAHSPTPKSAYASGEVAARAAAVGIPAYRFYNAGTGAHFYTTSVSERDRVQALLSPPFRYEGSAFSVASDFSPGLAPVHRFFNAQSGVHFYTISEGERASVVANLPQFSYEGVAYHASQVAGAGLTPLYRFYVPSRGFHFYTASQAERDAIQTSLSAVYRYEGVGYHVLASDWLAEKLPHTGITASQCFEQGNNSGFVACSSLASRMLNPDQDGHLVAVNPLSYAEIPNGVGGNHPRTSCVRDTVTGLIWEGKTATGERAASRLLTHHGDGRADDTSSYVAAINAMALCGWTDWRLPTAFELAGLVDHGRAAPMVNTAWFPNTSALYPSYWSATGHWDLPGDAWTVSFADGGYQSQNLRAQTHPVRLVRGAAPSGGRFSAGTATFGGTPVAGNVINDAWTGLQWRRCALGKTWNGSTCAGTAVDVSYDDASLLASDWSDWRLPNIKELATLRRLDRTHGPSLDPSWFPGSDGSAVWSSTPVIGAPDSAMAVYFENDQVSRYFKVNLFEVRLVRTFR